MAKRESQGMLIAVILLVIFSVLLCVSTYYFWSRSTSLDQSLTSSKSEASKANSGLREASREMQELKQLLGHAPDESMEVVQKTYEENMKLFGQDFPEEQRSYGSVPKYLLSTIRQMNKKVVEAGATEFQLKEQITQAQKDVEAANERADKRVGDLTQELSKEKEDFAKARVDMDKRVANLQAKFTASQRKVNVANTKLREERDGLVTKVDKLEFQIRNLARQIEQYENQSFDVPAVSYTHLTLPTTPYV